MLVQQMTSQQIIAAVLEAPTPNMRRMWCEALYGRGRVDGMKEALDMVGKMAEALPVPEVKL